jgi:hypothetical protein
MLPRLAVVLLIMLAVVLAIPACTSNPWESLPRQTERK